MTRYWMDTEFIEDGVTIDLISIGLVCEDGRELYLQSAEFNVSKANDWVIEHVLPHLQLCEHAKAMKTEVDSFVRNKTYHLYDGQCIFADPVKHVAGLVTDCFWRTRAQIEHEVLNFMDIGKYGRPELWGYYSAYDHVVFCQLFGTMVDLPPGFPMYTRDIKQWCDALGNPRLPDSGKGEHHALADAKWNKATWEFLREIEKTKRHA